MTAAPKSATYEDLRRLPDGTRAEIVAGQIVTLPAPRPRHSNVQRALGRFLGGPFHDDDGFGGPAAGGSSSRSTFSSRATTWRGPI